MARKRGRLDFNNEAPGIGKRHRAEKTGWKKERLLAIKLLLEGELDIAAAVWWDAIETVSMIGSSSS